MDAEVYSSEKVAEILNTKFISLKLQFDSTNKDNDYTQSQYRTTASLARQYAVKAFPTYLFLTRWKNCKQIHRLPEEDDFIKLAKNSLNPQKQYYTLLENYKQGKKKNILY